MKKSKPITNDVCIVHQGDRVLQVFPNSVDGLAYAEKLKKDHNIEASCDSIFSFAIVAKSKGYFEGYKDGWRD